MSDYKDLIGPGGDLNLKEKRRWEILRHRDSYRRDWDEAFAKMVECRKKVFFLGPDDLEGEQDREKQKLLIAEIMADPKTRDAFLKKQFKEKWPSGKLKMEFIYHSQEGKVVAQKYGLWVPYYYNDELWNPFTKRRFHVFRDTLPIRIITQGPEIVKRGPDDEAVIGPDGLITYDYKPHLRDGRFLTVELDLQGNVEEIKIIVASQIEYYHRELYGKPHKERQKGIDFYIKAEQGNKVSIYELWEMNKKEKKTPWEITQILYPSLTNGKSYQPASKNYNKEVRSQWKQINDGIERADREINSPL